MNEKIRVLIVDDEEITLTRMASMIAGSEHIEKVRTAKNGREALDMVIGFEPDIIFTDMRMPVMNGIEMIEEINKMNLTKKPNIVLVTSDRGADIVVKSRELHFGMIYKPASIEQVYEFINDYVGADHEEFKRELAEKRKAIENFKIREAGKKLVNKILKK